MQTCPAPRCPTLTTGGPCDVHKRAQRQVSDQARAQSPHRKLYQSSRWKAERADFLVVHPWCIDCQDEHRHTPATVVDHEQPHQGNIELFWNHDNWRSRCKPHHDRKTATRDGGGFSWRRTS